MMLVEGHAVIAQPLHLDPGIKMLGIGLHRDLGVEMLLLERVWQVSVDAQMVEMPGVGDKIENEYLHGHPSLGAAAALLRYNNWGTDGRSFKHGRRPANCLRRGDDAS